MSFIFPRITRDYFFQVHLDRKACWSLGQTSGSKLPGGLQWHLSAGAHAAWAGADTGCAIEHAGWLPVNLA